MNNKKNKKYYQRNNYYKNNNNKKKEEKTTSKKITYDTLLHADTVATIKKNEVDFNKLTIIKYIAITIILFLIIIGSLILFRNM